jgi:hypothetical protein
MIMFKQNTRARCIKTCEILLLALLVLDTGCDKKTSQQRGSNDDRKAGPAELTPLVSETFLKMILKDAPADSWQIAELCGSVARGVELRVRKGPDENELSIAEPTETTKAVAERLKQWETTLKQGKASAVKLILVTMEATAGGHAKKGELGWRFWSAYETFDSGSKAPASSDKADVGNEVLVPGLQPPGTSFHFIFRMDSDVKVPEAVVTFLFLSAKNGKWQVDAKGLRFELDPGHNRWKITEVENTKK